MALWTLTKSFFTSPPASRRWAVRFIADNQVKFKEAVFEQDPLRLWRHVNGLIGGEDHRHPRLLSLAASNRSKMSLGSVESGQGQIHHAKGVLIVNFAFLFGDLGVGTNTNRFNGFFCVRAPCAQSLSQ